MKKSTSKKSANQEGFFAALSQKCSSFAGLIVFGMLLLNLVVVFLFEKSRSPQVVYSVERVLVNTNDSSFVSVTGSIPVEVSSNVLSSVSDPVSSSSPVVRISTNYDYFMYGQSRLVKMFDRFFSEGSLTSYGRIVTIFPDRILLDDGSYINNSKWITGSSQPVEKTK